MWCTKHHSFPCSGTPSSDRVVADAHCLRDKLCCSPRLATKRHSHAFEGSRSPCVHYQTRLVARPQLPQSPDSNWGHTASIVLYNLCILKTHLTHLIVPCPLSLCNGLPHHRYREGGPWAVSSREREHRSSFHSLGDSPAPFSALSPPRRPLAVWWLFPNLSHSSTLCHLLSPKENWIFSPEGRAVSGS
jgi:hypothetical protein